MNLKSLGRNIEKKLNYFSLLQCIEENSSFLYRIQYAQTILLIDSKSGKIDVNKIENILIYGAPVCPDDPQENIFVDSVHSAICGSYRVFSGLWLNDSENLSRLLSAFRLVLDGNPKIVTRSLFLLELSDIIANRFGFLRYVNGNPNAEKLDVGDLEMFNDEHSKLLFTNSELSEISRKYGLTDGEISEFVFKANNKVLKEELKHYGYCPTLDAQPLYRCRDLKYLVLSPSSLLHTAFTTAYREICKQYGEDIVVDCYQKLIVDEAANCFEQMNGNVFHKESLNDSGVEYLGVRFDNDKVANVVVVDALRCSSLDSIFNSLAKDIINKHPDSKILNILVYSILDDKALGIMCNDAICLRMEDLKVFADQDQFSLMSLYYYNQDRKKEGFAPMSEEKNILAFYLHGKHSFYRDEKPSMFMVLPDFAQIMKAKYHILKDTHEVVWPETGSSVRLEHFADIPEGVPIYKPYMLPDVSTIVSGTDGGYLFWTRTSKEPEYLPLFREVVVSLSNWLYAIERKYGARLFEKSLNITVHFAQQGTFFLFQVSPSHCDVFFPLSFVDGVNPMDVEPRLVKEVCTQMIKLGYMNSGIFDDMIDNMFDEVGNGRFIQLVTNTSDPRSLKDSCSGSYNLNKRWADVILDEVADFVNQKGSERQLDLNESRELLRKVVLPLQQEALTLMKEFDTAYLIRRLLELYHGVVYWSSLSNQRCNAIDTAYRYICARFEKQEEYINNYAEIKTIAQGIVEYMILNDHHVKKESKGNVEMIDRLFALMHHELGMSICLDCVIDKVPGSEIVILPNGRLVYPQGSTEAFNSYFSHLRLLGMRYPDDVALWRSNLPDFDFDDTDDEFLNAFAAEYGCAYQQVKDLMLKSVDYSDARKEPVVSISEELFRKDVVGSILSDDEYASFKERMMLSTAQNVSTLEHHEYFIQRFNRETQFSTRPWILYEGQVLFSTKAIYEHILVFRDRIVRATLEAKSAEMKSFVSSINHSKGHHFNVYLKKYYDALGDEDLIVLSEIPMKPGCVLSPDTDLGDIDLLLIHRKKKLIVCVEAKNYYESRTVYEMLMQNRKIKSDIKKAEKRDQWCQIHIKDFAHWIGSIDESWSVTTVFLTYNEPVYKYLPQDNPSPLTLFCSMDIIKNPYCLFK